MHIFAWCSLYHLLEASCIKWRELDTQSPVFQTYTFVGQVFVWSVQLINGFFHKFSNFLSHSWGKCFLKVFPILSQISFSAVAADQCQKLFLDDLVLVNFDEWIAWKFCEFVDDGFEIIVDLVVWSFVHNQFEQFPFLGVQNRKLLLVCLIDISEEVYILRLEELRIDFIGKLRFLKKTFGKLLKFLSSLKSFIWIDAEQTPKQFAYRRRRCNGEIAVLFIKCKRWSLPHHFNKFRSLLRFEGKNAVNQSVQANSQTVEVAFSRFQVFLSELRGQVNRFVDHALEAQSRLPSLVDFNVFQVDKAVQNIVFVQFLEAFHGA